MALLATSSLAIRAAPWAMNQKNLTLGVTTPSITSSDPFLLASWERAIEIFNTELTRDEEKKIDLKDCPSASYMQLHQNATDAKARAEAKRFRWTPTVRAIFEQINRYAVAGDIITQFNAEYTSIAWGTIRFLLLFAVEEGNMTAMLSDGINQSMQIIHRAQEYALLFSTHSGSSTKPVFKQLQDNITHLYAEVLNFLVRATIFFKKKTPRRYFTAGFDNRFKGILDRIHQLQEDVRGDVALLMTEAEMQRQEHEDGVWLKPADVSNNKDDLLRRWIPDTCGWFLQSDKYLRWRDPSTDSQTSNLLWVQGKPGSGKSTIAAKIIQDLQLSSDSVVSYIFCKNGEENKTSLRDVLRNLIYQILYSNSSCKKSFHQIVRNARLRTPSPYAENMNQLWALMQQMLEKNAAIYCIVDGLDECNETADEQTSFLNRLSEVFSIAKTKARLAVISRLDSSGLSDTIPWSSIQIQPSNNREDIKMFVSVKLRESRALKLHSKRELLKKNLVENSDGMILWVELMIKELEIGHWDVDSVLNHPPKGLRAVYEAILQRLSKSTETHAIKQTLQLLLVAARPLHLDELALGLALFQGLSSHEDYALRGSPGQEGKDILRRTNPLLNVLPDNTVQLVHSSLKDLLLGNGNALGLAFENTHFEKAALHSTTASFLIRYLSFACSREDALGEASQVAPSNGWCFVDYSIRHLIFHSTHSPASVELAGKLVSFFESINGWWWLQRLEEEPDITFGHLQLMQAQLKQWSNFPRLDERYRNILEGFLLFLAQQRFEHSKASSTENETYLTAVFKLAKYWVIHGEYSKAEELQLQLIETSKRVLGAEHPSTLTSMNHLATTYNHQGRLIEAEKLQLQVTETMIGVLGLEHPSTLTSMNNLSETYNVQGQWAKAEELELRVMEAGKRLLGPEHPDTLTSMNNLALTYSLQGRWAEAEELQLQVMETMKRVLGAEHPDTLTSMANLAATYNNQGRWTEAEEIQLQMTETTKRVLGAEHPDTLTSMNVLAMTYIHQGRWTEAEELQLQVMETMKRVLGAEHPSTLTSMAILATTYSSQRRLAKAEELKLQLMEIMKRVLGPEHPFTLTSMSNLALTYGSQGRLTEAEELQLQVMETMKRVLGAEHPNTLTSMNNLATTYSSQKRSIEAEELRLKVMETMKRVLGAEHPTTLVSMNNLALTYKNQGRWTEAEQLQLQGIEIRKRVLGAEHPNTLTSMANLAHILRCLNRQDEAIRMISNVINSRTKIIGPNHPDTLDAVGSLNAWLTA